MPIKEVYIETVFKKRGDNGKFEYLVNCEGEEGHGKNVLMEMHKEFMEAIKHNLHHNSDDSETQHKKEKKDVPEKVLGSVMKSGELIFLIKWKHKNEITFICAADAKIQFPMLLIDYFEKQLKWKPIQV